MPKPRRLPTFFHSRVHLGLVYALASVILYWLAMTRTRFARCGRSGAIREAARRLGIPIVRYMLIVMFMAGGIAGIAGMAEVTATQGRLVSEPSPGYAIGFLVAWLAGTSASGIDMSFASALISLVGDILQITRCATRWSIS